MPRAVLAVSLIVLTLLATGALAGEHAVRVHLTVADRGEIARLTRLVSIDDVRGLEVWAYASPAQLLALRKAGFTWQEVPEPRNVEALTACPAGWDTNPARAWTCYPSYQQYVGFLAYECTNHAAICRLHDLGPTTNTSRPHRLYAVEITDNPDVAEDEPEVLYASTIHGDETTGYMMMLRLVDTLLALYGSDPEVTGMVDGLEIWVNPLHNPDGTYYGSDSSVASAIRDYTSTSGSDSWVDGNRNFPDPQDGAHPDGNAYWVETQTMMDFAAAHHFVISANFHGGAEVVNYPWDTQARLHVDDAHFVNVSRAYADLAQADGPAGYMTDLNNGITNGYAWYEVNGGRQDFMTYWHGCREVTIEVSYDKLPDSSQLPTYWNANRRALYGWIQEALEGVRGVVTSSAGGPLDATVEVVGHDAAVDNSYVSTDPAVGDYHRMLLPGTYTLRFSAYGHQTQDVSSVVVSSGAATRVDVVLQQLASYPVSGLVSSPGVGPLVGATVTIVGTPLAPATTGADGRYSFAAVEAGAHAFAVAAAGYETVSVSRTVAAPGSVFDFGLAPFEVAVSTDLETSNGGLVPSGSPAPGWQWGVPSGSGNPGAHSGTHVWATVLAGNYVDNAQWYLDLSTTLPAGAPQLLFWHWYVFESGDWDGGNVSISTNGGSSWTLLTPAGGYPSSNVDALGQPGYAVSSGGWEQASFDLATYAGATVKIRWHFASDYSNTELGWYLDDISLIGVTHAAAFEYAPASPMPGETVQFSDRSTGPVASWSWSFGDSSTSTVQSPSHVFAVGGSYLVTLQVTLDGGATLSHQETVEVGVVDPNLLFADGFETGDTSGWADTVP